VSVVYLRFSNFLAISWREQVNFQRDDDEICFALDQHTELDFYRASSLKQQSVGRHVAPLGHIILIPSRQPVFALSP
jgi:predicted alpha/beta hydrolase